MLAHLLVAEPVEAGDLAGDAFARIGILAAGEAGDDVLLEPVLVVGAHRRDAAAGLGEQLVRIGRRCIRPLQDMDVIGDEIGHVEAQRIAARGALPHEIGARPIDHRHEIVADRLDAAPRQAGHAGLPGVDLVAIGAVAELDLRRDGNRFADAPAQARLLDDALAREHVVDRPRPAVIDMVQGRDDAGGAGLLHMVEGDRIFRAEPAPALLHGLFLRDVYRSADRHRPSGAPLQREF